MDIRKNFSLVTRILRVVCFAKYKIIFSFFVMKNIRLKNIAYKAYMKTQNK